MGAKCPHLHLSSIYERGPKSNGSKFIPCGKKCRDCGALLPPFGKQGDSR